MKCLLLSITLLFSITAFAQIDGVQIDYGTPTLRNDDALLELNSSTQGMLVPRVSQTERVAIAPNAAAKGLLVYQNDNTQGFYYWDGAAWVRIPNTSGNDFIKNQTGQQTSADFNIDGDGILDDITIQGNDINGATIGDANLNINSKGGVRAQLDSDNDGSETFAVKDGSGNIVFQVDEGNDVSNIDDITMSGNITTGNSKSISAGTAFKIQGNGDIDMVIDADNSGTGSEFTIKRDGTTERLFRINEDGAARFHKPTSGTGTVTMDYLGGTNNRIVYTDNNGLLGVLAAGTSGQILQSNGTSAPTFTDPTGLFTFDNGLTETAPNTVRLGGALVTTTTITHGGNDLIHNLSGTGDFTVQDAGTQVFNIFDNGKSMFGVDASADNANTLVDIVGSSSGAVLNLLTLRNDNTAISTGVGLKFVNSTANNSAVGSEIVSVITNVGGTGGSDFKINNHSGTGGLVERMKISSNGSVTVANLVGTGSRTVFANSSGTLITGQAIGEVMSFSSNIKPSPDDITNNDILGAVSEGISVQNLGFSFNIGGTAYTQITISPNGYIVFGSVTEAASDQNNVCLPTSLYTNPMICMYWDDLVAENGGDDGGNIDYQTAGSAGGRIAIIEGEEETVSGGNDVNWIVVIHEGGMITVRYYPDYPASSTGQGGTIGFQTAGGSSAKAYSISCNASVLNDNSEHDQGWSVFIPQTQ